MQHPLSGFVAFLAVGHGESLATWSRMIAKLIPFARCKAFAAARIMTAPAAECCCSICMFASSTRSHASHTARPRLKRARFCWFAWHSDHNQDHRQVFLGHGLITCKKLCRIAGHRFHANATAACRDAHHQAAHWAAEGMQAAWNPADQLAASSSGSMKLQSGRFGAGTALQVCTALIAPRAPFDPSAAHSRMGQA